MDSDLLPVHVFTEFKKYEITNRMECVKNKIPEVCINHCEGIPGLTWKEKFECFKQYEVPSSIYAVEMCGLLHNQTTDYDEFFYCITYNRAPDVTLKEACKVSDYNMT